MIKLSKTHSISFKNGYFMSHENAISSKDSKTPGVEFTTNRQTYATLLGIHAALKEKGEDGSKIIAVGEKLLRQSQFDAGREVIQNRATKLAKENKQEVVAISETQ